MSVTVTVNFAEQEIEHLAARWLEPELGTVTRARVELSTEAVEKIAKRAAEMVLEGRAA
jgi:hypothetical protein